MIFNDSLLPDVTKFSGDIISQLASFIRIPSISAGPGHKNDILNCAGWLASHLRQVGLDHVKIIPTKNHPVVYADWLHAPGKPTLLIYGHYDVQPVDPVNEWKDDPFSGRVKDGYIYGRGSSDDKGQLFAHVKALEHFLKHQEKIPVNIKCVFEGEEEIGSPGLTAIVKQSPELLAADVCVVSDMSIPSPAQPAITYSLRGMLSLELEIKGQKRDLHSGTFGGAVDNPAQVLSAIIASFYDKKGRITIPGFYNNVKEKSREEREYMYRHGRSDKTILSDAGTSCGWGEQGYSAYERIATRPSLSINGIRAGYQGEGPKAIIPSVASAKLSFRLVPDQDPDHIDMLFRRYIDSIAPACMIPSIIKVASAKPVVIDPGDPYIRSAAKAYEKVFKQKVRVVGSGGTIPIVNHLHEDLSMPVVMMGFALPDDGPHGPNEKFFLANFQKGIATSICFMQELSRL